MADVVLQFVVFILIAAALGFAAGWMLRGWGLDGSTRMSDGYERQQREALLRELNTARAERDEARTKMLAMRAAQAVAPASNPERARSVAAPSPAAAVRAAPSSAAASPAAAAPASSPAVRAPSTPPPAAADELQRIKGVGPKLEQTLLAMGVTRFAQIAAWSEADLEEIGAKLRFRGRIERDGWIEQARKLAAE